MAEYRQGQQYQQHHQYQQPQQQYNQQQQYGQHHATDAIKGMLPQHGPSKSQVLAVVTLLPVGATLLFLAGLTLVGTVVGVTVATPLFVIFSPVLVPAAIVIGLSVTGVLTSGAFGVTALSSLAWMANFLRKSGFPQQMEQAKRGLQDTAGYMGQKVRETGHNIQEKAYEAGREVRETGQNVQNKAREAGREAGEGGRGREAGDGGREVKEGAREGGRVEVHVKEGGREGKKT